MEYFLLQKTAKSNPLKLILKDDEVVVGRSSFKNIPSLQHVSRRHASFQVTSNGSWFVKDLSSMNGVFLNGNKISKGLHALNINDSVSFGAPQFEGAEELEFLFCFKDGEDPSPSIPEVRHTVFEESVTSTNQNRATLPQPASSTSTIDEVKRDDVETRVNTTTTSVKSNDNCIPSTSRSSLALQNHEVVSCNKSECVNIKKEIEPSEKIPELENPPCTSASPQYELVILESDEENDDESCHFKCTSRGWKGQLHFNVKTEVPEENNEEVNFDATSNEAEPKNPCPITVKPNCTVVKVEPMIKTEALQDELGYSQQDEVIVVSDDEDYLNFSSQGNNIGNIDDVNENNIRIKDEPCDDLEFNWKSDLDGADALSNDGIINDQNCLTSESGKNFENSNAGCESTVKVGDKSDISTEKTLDFPTAVGINNDKSELSTDCIPESENIINIQKFLSNANQMNALQSTGLDEQSANVPSDTDFFPVLSQSFYSQKELPIAEDNSKEEDNKSKPVLSKTLLIEPKLMVQRPKCQRGREEWFDDHSVSPKSFYGQPKETPSKPKKHRKRKHKALKQPVAVDEQHVKRKKSKVDLRQKIKSQMGHRIRTPNGGSAIPMSSGESKNPTKKDSSVIPPAVVKEGSKAESKVPAVTNQKAQRFGSRMDFLIDPLPNKKVKSKGATVAQSSKTNGTFKIPKLSSVAHDKGNHSSSPCAPKEDENSELKRKQNSSPLLNKSPAQVKELPLKKIKPRHDDNNHSTTNRCLSNVVNVPKFVSQAPPFFNNNIPVQQTNSTSFTDPGAAIEPSTSKCSPRPNVSGYAAKDPRLKLVTNQENISCTSSNDRHFQKNRPVNQVPPFIVSSSHQGRPLKVSQLKLPEKLDSDTLITEIIKYWNPSWLKQYEQIGKPPTPVRKDAGALPLAFDSLYSYAYGFYSLIRLELWEIIYLDWKDRVDKDIICFSISQCTAKGDILVLECESVLHPIIHSNVREGSLVIVELREKNRQEVVMLFGYISFLRTQPLPNPTLLHKAWQQRPQFDFSNSALFKFSIRTKKKLVSLELDKLMKATVVSYIANKVRLADTFQIMVTTPVTPAILNPTGKTFSVDISVNVKPVLEKIVGNYNDRQSYAIASFAACMRGHFLQPKMLLLQGPPGTGKTHTIVGIVQALLRREGDNVKILLAAPSNAAVDEIGRRLLQLKRQNPRMWGEKKLKIVRIGNHKQIHADMQRYSLDSLTIQNSKKSRMRDEEVLKKAVLEKIGTIAKLQADITTMANRDERDDIIKRKMSELNMEIRRKQYAQNEWKLAHKRLLACSNTDDYSCKLNVLKNANIVLSTLGSCRQRVLEQCFGQNSDTHFTCCIIDEATQCTEPELLQPLVFGLCKFILVGDHQQLSATIQSKEARDYNFERSLFERINLFCQRNGDESPIYMLTEQYRMHSEICSFPSRHFYSNKLVTNVNIDCLFTGFPLKPFIMLNIIYGQESNTHSSKANALEAKSLIDICTQMLAIVPKNVSMGIITPYTAQKNLYTSELASNSNTSCIEVNTVDGFQGREKDIILVSCVRAKSSLGGIGFLACKKRLNVAITRARMCLIICGHLDSLKNDPNWTDLLNYARERGRIIPVTDLQDLSFLLSEMRKNRPC